MFENDDRRGRMDIGRYIIRNTRLYSIEPAGLVPRLEFKRRRKRKQNSGTSYSVLQANAYHTIPIFYADQLTTDER
jgi:hypothetical protein